VVCKEAFKIEEMEADHIIPWHEGGKTDEKIVKCFVRKTIAESQESKNV